MDKLSAQAGHLGTVLTGNMHFSAKYKTTAQYNLCVKDKHVKEKINKKKGIWITTLL